MHSAKELAALIAKKLNDNREQLGTAWNAPENTATRHFVIDDLLSNDIACAIAEAFPTDGNFWRKLDTFRERKKTFAKLDQLDPFIASITDAFHLEDVLSAIKKITRLNMLEADPSLYAGGISLMQHGDFLNPHIDNSHDAERKRYRRLNLLYYVSPNWRSENGGNLELWDSGVKAPKEIVSSFNRLVVMETNKTSWHSVNPVLADTSRCCVSNYYFSTTSPAEEEYYHVTSFLGRPCQPVRRLYGRIDNALRQSVAEGLKFSRGKKLGRYE